MIQREVKLHPYVNIPHDCLFIDVIKGFLCQRLTVSIICYQAFCDDEKEKSNINAVIEYIPTDNRRRSRRRRRKIVAPLCKNCYTHFDALSRTIQTAQENILSIYI